MADCNKTVDFLRVLKRYCAEQHCYDCPICPPDGTVGDTCIASVGEAGLQHAETIITDMDYAQVAVDRRLQPIYGDKFAPWEERYGG